MTEDIIASVEGRPYRSHVHPACLPCRARKSRCKTTGLAPETSCAMCEAHGTLCVFPTIAERLDRRFRIPGRGSSNRTRRDMPSDSTQSRRQQSSTSSAGTTMAHATAHTALSAGPPRPSSRLHPRVLVPHAPPAARMRCPASTSPTLSQRVLQSYTSPNESTSTASPRSTTTPQTSATSILVAAAPDMEDMIAEADKGSSHVVSPAIADDDLVFQTYLSNSAAGGQSRRMVRCSRAGGGGGLRPILFNITPRRGDREAESRALAATHCAHIETLIAPYREELIDVFFSKFNTAFPIFDEARFRRVFVRNRACISPALLAFLYGNTLTYWSSSPQLSSLNTPPPPQRSVWLQAEDAFNAERAATPGISTILAILLNLSGRPSTHHLGNGVLLGMAVSLGNACGLNRDPTAWNLAPSEKQFRVRIWWLLVVYDRWCSLAYGTPPMILRTQQDVPMITVDDVPSGLSTLSAVAAAGFVALVTLTADVLGPCLEQVYHLGDSGSDINDSDRITTLENRLTHWEDALDDNLRRLVIRGGVHLGPTNPSAGPGAANLRLAYLSVKLLICRCRIESSSPSSIFSSATPDTAARRAAEEIVDFVRELDADHLADFWMPPNAFALTSATTFLLRSALHARGATGITPIGTARNAPLALARIMITTLQSHRRLHNWDMADNCLANCGDLVDKIEAACEGDYMYSNNIPAMQVPGVMKPSEHGVHDVCGTVVGSVEESIHDSDNSNSDRTPNDIANRPDYGGNSESGFASVDASTYDINHLLPTDMDLTMDFAAFQGMFPGFSEL